MRNYRNSEPFIMNAKFNSKCNETEKPIKKGDSFLYYPIGKSAYHLDSKQAQDWREMKQDDDFINASF